MTLSALRPDNMLLMPSFVSQDLMPDGYHLTPVSGLHYVLHIFDQVELLLTLDHHGPDAKLGHVQETVRQHDDRLSYLESRHGGLQGQVDLRLASDSEFRDWSINRSEEDYLTILGLPRLGEMNQRDWQSAAKKQVKDLIKLVLNLNRINLTYSILFVSNPVRHRTTGQTVYNVKLDSVAASQRIRDLYSGFFRKEKPIKLPIELRGVSVKNKVTLDTRVRIRIMQELAANYQAANPGSVATVRGFDPRPTMMITPARGSSDRPRVFNFIDAATKLKAVFSDDSLAKIFQVIGTNHQGELQSVFIVLNDDDRARCEDLAKNYRRAPNPRSKGSHVPTTSSATASGFVSGSGGGVTLESTFIESIRRGPPPPPPPASALSPEPERTRDRSRSRSVSSRPDPKSKKSEPSDRDSKRGKRSRRSSSSSSESSRDTRRHKKAKSKKSKRSHRSRSPSSASSYESGSASATTRVSKKKTRK